MAACGRFIITASLAGGNLATITAEVNPEGGHLWQVYHHCFTGEPAEVNPEGGRLWQVYHHCFTGEPAGGSLAAITLEVSCKGGQLWQLDNH